MLFLWVKLSAAIFLLSIRNGLTPRSENLSRFAKEQGIETLEACTLVLLSTGQY